MNRAPILFITNTRNGEPEEKLMPSSSNFTLGIVAGRKATDAVLCECLEQAFPNVKIVQYRIPFGAWVPWIIKRIREMGPAVLIGHLLLSIFLRVQRFYENLRGRSLWLKFGSARPNWRKVRTRSKFCFSELAARQYLKDTDAIILLDSFRFSHQWYRDLPVPIFQIIWGMMPDYTGDSGAFWAYALGQLKRIGVTVIVRGAEFNSFSVLAERIISAGDKETIRTIKIRQAQALVATLPGALQLFLERARFRLPLSPAPVAGRLFRAPTIGTYLRFLRSHRLVKIPGYAYKDIRYNIESE